MFIYKSLIKLLTKYPKHNQVLLQDFITNKCYYIYCVDPVEGVVHIISKEDYNKGYNHMQQQINKERERMGLEIITPL